MYAQIFDGEKKSEKILYFITVIFRVYRTPHMVLIAEHTAMVIYTAVNFKSISRSLDKTSG